MHLNTPMFTKFDYSLMILKHHFLSDGTKHKELVGTRINFSEGNEDERIQGEQRFITKFKATSKNQKYYKSTETKGNIVWLMRKKIAQRE